MPNTTSPRPSADKRGADEVEPRSWSGGVSAIRRVSSEDHEHDEDLAGEHERHERYVVKRPPIERPGGHRDRAGGRDEAVGAWAFGARKVRGNQRDDRRHDQRGADALEHRPTHASRPLRLRASAVMSEPLP